MKKIVITTVVASAVILAFAKPVHAEEVGVDKSDVGVSFDTDGPVKPGPGPYKDNLALVWTPSKFTFGQQKATAGIATYNNTVVGDQYLVVNDDRQEETTSAWKTTATLSKMVSTDSTATELPAKLTFTLGAAEAYDIGTTIDPDTNDYVANPITGNLSALTSGNIVLGNSGSKNITLEAGNTTAQKIIGKSASDKVKGGFATKLSQTRLVVTTGTGAAGKNFKGNVTWSLDNTY